MSNKRNYSLDPAPRMIENIVDDKELISLKRMLLGREWEIMKRIFANAATCSALSGEHAEARVWEIVSKFDVDALESMMESDAFNAPKLAVDEVHGEPSYIEP